MCSRNVSHYYDLIQSICRRWKKPIDIKERKGISGSFRFFFCPIFCFSDLQHWAFNDHHQSETIPELRHIIQFWYNITTLYLPLRSALYGHNHFYLICIGLALYLNPNVYDIAHGCCERFIVNEPKNILIFNNFYCASRMDRKDLVFRI